MPPPKENMNKIHRNFYSKKRTSFESFLGGIKLSINILVLKSGMGLRTSSSSMKFLEIVTLSRALQTTLTQKCHAKKKQQCYSVFAAGLVGIAKFIVGQLPKGVGVVRY